MFGAQGKEAYCGLNSRKIPRPLTPLPRVPHLVTPGYLTVLDSSLVSPLPVLPRTPLLRQSKLKGQALSHSWLRPLQLAIFGH